MFAVGKGGRMGKWAAPPALATRIRKQPRVRRADRAQSGLRWRHTVWVPTPHSFEAAHRNCGCA
eukprot:3681769-Prymnesium_polylepis.1